MEGESVVRLLNGPRVVSEQTDGVSIPPAVRHKPEPWRCPHLGSRLPFGKRYRRPYHRHVGTSHAHTHGPRRAGSKVPRSCPGFAAVSVTVEYLVRT
jgi:hypothetical protein